MRKGAEAASFLIPEGLPQGVAQPEGPHKAQLWASP